MKSLDRAVTMVTLLDPATGLAVGTSFPMQTLTRLRGNRTRFLTYLHYSPIDINFNAGGQAGSSAPRWSPVITTARSVCPR